MYYNVFISGPGAPANYIQPNAGNPPPNPQVTVMTVQANSIVPSPFIPFVDPGGTGATGETGRPLPKGVGIAWVNT